MVDQGHGPTPPRLAMATGNLEAFDPGSSDWETYQARLELYLLANDVQEEKKVATALTLLGGPTYKLLCNLLAPAKPSTKSLADIMTALEAHYSPKPLVIAERYRFNKRDQQSGESLKDYMAELRRLARHCDFGSSLDDNLRDRLVCGLNNQTTIRKLLAESSLTLKKAIEIAQAIETANKDATELHRPTAAAHQLRVRPPRFHGKGRHTASPTTASPATTATSAAKGTPAPKPCYRCGGTNHKQEDCRFKDAACNHCGKLGHIAKACRQRRLGTSKQQSQAAATASTQGQPKKSARAHALAEAQPGDSDEEFYIRHNGASTSPRRTSPIWLEPLVNGQRLKMELDTGSALSILPSYLYKQHFRNVRLSPTSTELKTYTDERVIPDGEIHVTVEYNKQQVEAQLLVVDTRGPPLFGRDWLQIIQIDWPRINHASVSVTRPQDPPSVSATSKTAENLNSATKRRLQQLLSENSALFGNDRGKLRTCKGHLHLREDATPKFCKARPLPYSLRGKVADELDQLERDGILTKVSYSDWATPIVPIAKKDGSVRICGDFKVTVNPQLQISSTRFRRSKTSSHLWQEENISPKSIFARPICKWRWPTSLLRSSLSTYTKASIASTGLRLASRPHPPFGNA